MPPETSSENAPILKQQRDDFDPSQWIEALPLAGLLVSIAVSAIYGFPTGLMVIGATLLLVGIWNLWVSLQLVAGDRPRQIESIDTDAPSYEEEQKAFLLRALDDLEFERSVGKVDEDDYQALRQQYRERAKQALAGDSHADDPLRQRAKLMAQAYLKEKGVKGPLTTDKTQPLDPSNDTKPGAADESEGKVGS